MSEYDYVTPQCPHDVGKQRHPDLKDYSFSTREAGAAFVERRRYERPDYHAAADERQEFPHGRPEQRAEYDSKSADQDAHVDRKPERSHTRSTVALGHILPCKRRRKMVLLDRFTDVGDSVGKRRHSKTAG